MALPGRRPQKPHNQRKHHQQVFSTIGYKRRLDGHGTRHTASTLLREHGFPKEHVEAQLAHKEGGVSGVYNKAQYLEHRVKMMQWYADHLDELATKNAAQAQSGEAA